MSDRDTPRPTICSEMSGDKGDIDMPGKKPPAQEMYCCPQCPRSFKRPENLKRHQRGHDEHKKFTCSKCGKSFSRSDILGRHEAVHVAREGRNEHPHRKRACHECARVRERCSRGEPCRRCKTKGLCCLYPEESRFKISMPDAWTPSTPGSDGYDVMTIDEAQQPPVEAFHPRRDLTAQDYISPRYEADDNAPDLYRRSLLPSIFSNWDSYHSPPEYEDVSFLSSIDCNTLQSRRGGCANRRSNKKSKYNDAEPFMGDVDPERFPQYYRGATQSTHHQQQQQQTMHYSDEAALRDLDAYLASQEQRDAGSEQQLLHGGGGRRRHTVASSSSHMQGLLHTRPSAPLSLKCPAFRYNNNDNNNNNSTNNNNENGVSEETDANSMPYPFRPSTSTSTSTSTSASVSSSAASLEQQQRQQQPRLVNIRDYEVIATRLKEFRHRNRLTSLGSRSATTAATTTDRNNNSNNTNNTNNNNNGNSRHNNTPRTEQHDALLKLYFEYFSNNNNNSNSTGQQQQQQHSSLEVGGLEERLDGCLDTLFV